MMKNYSRRFVAADQSLQQSLQPTFIYPLGKFWVTPTSRSLTGCISKAHSDAAEAKDFEAAVDTRCREVVREGGMGVPKQPPLFPAAGRPARQVPYRLRTLSALSRSRS
jgi:hypothetical protein